MSWLMYIIGDAAFAPLRAYLVSRSTRKIISVRLMRGFKGSSRKTKIGFQSCWNSQLLPWSRNRIVKLIVFVRILWNIVHVDCYVVSKTMSPRFACHSVRGWIACFQSRVPLMLQNGTRLREFLT